MTVKIAINGPIIDSSEKWIYDYFEEEATCAKDISDALPKNGEDVEVTINSFGGYVDQGAEIYTLLSNYPGNVAINVVTAYSAASVAAMAGNPTRISPIGQMMIHNASGVGQGDYRDMVKASERLKITNEALSNAYTIKTGKTKDEILAMMDEETWLTPEKAKELGFVDEIMFAERSTERLVANNGGMLPPSIIEKMRAEKQEEKLNKLNNEPKPEEVSPFARFIF